jgi:hypothetical protein
MLNTHCGREREKVMMRLLTPTTTTMKQSTKSTLNVFFLVGFCFRAGSWLFTALNDEQTIHSID